MSEISINNPRIAAVNSYHEQALSSARNAMLYAVKAGAELLALKKEVGHGNFEATVKRNCQFTIRTARKYMAVAMTISNRNHGSDLTSIPEPKLLNAIHHTTGAASISELYKDLGIIKDQRVAKKVERRIAAENQTEEDRHTIAQRALLAAEDNLTTAINNADALDKTDFYEMAKLCLTGLGVCFPSNQIAIMIDPKTPRPMADHIEKMLKPITQ
jgi:hypothetical protein